MTRNEIAARFKQLRETRGMTQEEAANKIGRKRQTLAAWETGVSQPDADTFFELCDLYGVSAEEFRGESSQNQKKPDQIKYDLGMSFEELVERYSGLTVDMRKLVSQFVLMAEVWQKTQPGRNVEGQELVQILAQRVTESPDLREESATLEIG